MLIQGSLHHVLPLIVASPAREGQLHFVLAKERLNSSRQTSV